MIREGVPIQSKGAQGIKGQIVLKEEFVPGLKDLEGFSHIILIYHLHKSEGYELVTKPLLDTTERGVFSTRAPKRPNQIGMSVVKLVSIENNCLNIEDIDILDGTPLLEIKPYIPDFDVFKTEKNGWVGNKADKLHEIKSDKRFE